MGGFQVSWDLVVFSGACIVVTGGSLVPMGIGLFFIFCCVYRCHSLGLLKVVGLSKAFFGFVIDCGQYLFWLLLMMMFAILA